MPTATELSTQVKDLLTASFENIIAYLPGILGALVIFFVGWLAARLIRTLTTKALTLLNRFLDKVLMGRTRGVVRFSSGVTRLTATTLFWVTLFIFSTAALRIAGLDTFAAWLERIVDYLPSILTGGLIILIGYILSSLVRDITQAAAYSAELAEAELISRLAQTITFVTAIIIGIDQAGVNISFITTMLGVSTAALLAGFALAFGLGARTLVSNLIASYYLKELIEPGQQVRIGEWQGTVLDISPTTVIINSADGRISIPAKLYQEQAVTLLVKDSADE